MSLNKEISKYILETYEFVTDDQARDIANGVEYYLYETVIPDAVNDNVDKEGELK